ncbi:MAG: TPR repeat-containing protein [bacterium]|nr:MAG: TPR repeat-containing protein [bacterium]
MKIFQEINRQEKLFFLLPIFLVVVCFASTFKYQFVYDDLFQVIEASSALGDWSKENLASLFGQDIWSFFNQKFASDGKSRSQYYRPIFGLAFMVNYYYAGLNPIAWHVTSVILHIIAVLLSYQLIINSLQIIFSQNENQLSINSIALIASICFAIHPVQSESVAWVSAYVNALNSIFIFAALIFYLKLSTSYRWIFISSIFYILALLTKESAIVLPAILVGYEVFLTARNTTLLSKLRLAIIRLIPFIIITVGYFYLRIIIFGSIKAKASAVDFPEMEKNSLLNTLTSLPTILLTYLKILIWPFSNNPMYETRLVFEPNLFNFYLPLILLLLITILTIILAFKSKLLQLGLIWLVIPLIPVLDLRSFKPEDLIHDRYLYLSCIGFGIIIAFLTNHLNSLLTNNKPSQLHPIASILLLGLLIITSITTISQNNAWANEWQLWSTAYKNVPNSCIVNLELGRLSEEDKKNDTTALFYYQRVKAICPDSLTLNYKLGLLYGRNNDLKNSELAFQNMLKLAKNRFILSTAYFNLGLINEKRGELALAINNYQKGLKLNPEGPNSQQVQQIVKELTEKLKLDKSKL